MHKNGSLPSAPLRVVGIQDTLTSLSQASEQGTDFVDYESKRKMSRHNLSGNVSSHRDCSNLNDACAHPNSLEFHISLLNMITRVCAGNVLAGDVFARQ